MNKRPWRNVPAMEALEELLMLSCSITWDEVDQVSPTRTRVAKTGNLVVAVESSTTVCGLGAPGSRGREQKPVNSKIEQEYEAEYAVPSMGDESILKPGRLL